MIRFRSVGFAAVGLAVVLGFGREAAAQTSMYYLTDPATNLIYGIRGGQLVLSTPFAYDPNPGLDPDHPSSASQYEGGIAVYGDVRTVGYMPGAIGGQYSLGLTPTGTSYNFPGPGFALIDGTSDGTYNYGVEGAISETIVVRYDRNWANPEIIIDNLNGDIAGIAYDRTNNSLWLQNFRSGEMYDFSMNGTVLSQFAPGTSRVTGLGYDPADGTLWAAQSGRLYQYSTAGQLLQSIDVPGFVGNPYGGDFDESIGASAVPEPAALVSALIGLGITAGCIAIHRRRTGLHGTGPTSETTGDEHFRLGNLYICSRTPPYTTGT